MPDVVALGPVMLQGATVKLALSALAAWVCAKWLYGKAGLWDPAYSDLLFHMAVITVVVWKISPLVFHIPEAMNQPLIYMLAPGTREGLWAGGALAAVYAAAVARYRRRIALPLFADAVATGAIVAVFVYNVLGWRYGAQTSLPWGIAAADPAFRYHPVNAYTALLAAGIFVVIRRRPGPAKPGAAASEIMMWLGAGMLAISFFQPALQVWPGLSPEQWVCAILSLSGVALARFGLGKTH